MGRPRFLTRSSFQAGHFIGSYDAKDRPSGRQPGRSHLRGALPVAADSRMASGIRTPLGQVDTPGGCAGRTLGRGPHSGSGWLAVQPASLSRRFEFPQRDSRHVAAARAMCDTTGPLQKPATCITIASDSSCAATIRKSFGTAGGPAAGSVRVSVPPAVSPPAAGQVPDLPCGGRPARAAPVGSLVAAVLLCVTRPAAKPSN